MMSRGQGKDKYKGESKADKDQTKLLLRGQVRAVLPGHEAPARENSCQDRHHGEITMMGLDKEIYREQSKLVDYFCSLLCISPWVSICVVKNVRASSEHPSKTYGFLIPNKLRATARRIA